MFHKCTFKCPGRSSRCCENEPLENNWNTIFRLYRKANIRWSILISRAMWKYITKKTQTQMWILFKSIHIHSFHVVTVWLRPWQHCESSMITPRAGLYLAAVQGSLKAFVKLVFTVNDYIISQLESISETEERERERETCCDGPGWMMWPPEVGLL